MGTQPARGMRDFLPEDVRRREYVVRVVRDVYDRYGFEPLETPAVENIETLVGRYGDEGSKLIFKILKRGEHEATGQADLALRYDLTVPLARVVAEHQARLPKFFKRYQIQPVWRAERPARGRFREFYQCDIDSIGSTSPVVEAEQIAAVSEILKALQFKSFSIRLNHRGVLRGILLSAGIENGQHGDVLVALDKRDKIGESGVEIELGHRGLDRATIGRLLALTALLPAALDPFDELDVLDAKIGSDPEAHGAIDNLRAIFRLAGGAGAGSQLIFDKSLARGLSYYTGAIMEIAVPDLPGSLGGGGRYDNLIGTFLGREIPACGFSLGLERILVVMDGRKMFPESVADRNADVMVAIWEPELDWEADALALASSLRASGIRTDVYPDPEPRKVSRQFKYADARRIPLVAIVGPDERARNMVNVKDLRSGQQHLCERSKLGEAIKQLLSPKAIPI